ncbi:MAG: ABC transporter ATP-binding protein NatA [Candidatus Anoxychlamydiales bacterium]|nr:ABC transporter ATP-binding protein NatA [Candidatus Anoxychlamydiales bacterium]
MNNYILEIKEIKKTYFFKKQKIEALKNINLNIFKGEVISLLGVNGAGKTTLSSIIATLLNQTEGDILYKNKSIYEDITNYRRILGFCPQVQNLDNDLNVIDNLIFAGRYYGLSKTKITNRVEELLQKFDLKKYEKFNLDQLSGGYKQRFMIARTLMHDPTIIIMDEPTVGLDPQLRRLIWKFIMDLREEKKTIILTTHYLDEADILSDRICVIHNGSVIALDSPKILKENRKSTRLEDVFIELIKEKEDEK